MVRKRKSYGVHHGLHATAILFFVVASAMAGEMDDDWFTRERPGGQDERNAAVDAMEGRPAPAIDGPTWANTEPLDWGGLKGRVVLIDFWGAWCGPCVEAIPHLTELFKKNKERGFTVLGVHTKKGAAHGKRWVRLNKVPYPVVFDEKDEIYKRFRIDSYPDYYLVDHRGVLRFANLDHYELDEAVEYLPAERERAPAEGSVKEKGNKEGNKE